MTEITATTEGTRGGSVTRALAPLLLDVGVPLGGYYLLRHGMGVSLVTALTVSSVMPAACGPGGPSHATGRSTRWPPSCSPPTSSASRSAT